MHWAFFYFGVQLFWSISVYACESNACLMPKLLLLSMATVNLSANVHTNHKIRVGALFFFCHVLFIMQKRNGDPLRNWKSKYLYTYYYCMRVCGCQRWQEVNDTYTKRACEMILLKLDSIGIQMSVCYCFCCFFADDARLWNWLCLTGGW